MSHSGIGGPPDTDPRSSHWAADDSSPFRRSEVTARIGRGDDVWQRASASLLRWGVKTRSGFIVDGARTVAPEQEVTIRARVAGLTVREPVQVRVVIREETRVGFSYRTLPGHPVSGEEAFILDRRGDEVFLTVRSLTAPASTGPWRVLYPVLRLAQVVARRRYLRALR